MTLADASVLFELDPVTVALRAWIEAAVLTGADGEAVFPVGDAQTPLDDDDLPVPPPYGVLHQLGAVRTLPPHAGAPAITARWQVTTIAGTPSQARHWADRVRRAVAGETDDGVHALAMVLPGSGVLVIRRGSQDDGYLEPAGGVWSWRETYDLELTPA